MSAKKKEKDESFTKYVQSNKHFIVLKILRIELKSHRFLFRTNFIEANKRYLFTSKHSKNEMKRKW